MCPKDFTNAGIINTAQEQAPTLSDKWRFVGVMASVSERNLKARETGGLSIASNRVFCHTKMHDFERYGASTA